MDISPELLKNILEDFNRKYRNNKKLIDLVATIDNKTATYEDAYNFSVEIGNMLASSFDLFINADDLPNRKMYYNIAEKVIGETLGYNHKLVSEFAKDVQTVLNKQSGMNINGVAAEISRERIEGLINKVSSDDFDKVKWVLDEPVKTFAKKIVDDTVKANAKIHKDLGLKPQITRVVHSNACSWCKNLAGQYNYGDESPDVYKRHAYCNCVVTYTPKGYKKPVNVWSKKEHKVGNDQKKNAKTNNHNIETFSKRGYNDVNKLSNNEVRIWYHDKLDEIDNLVDKTKSIEEQAIQAFELRNKIRSQARELMDDAEAREYLEKNKPINTDFEKFVEEKMKRKNMTREQAYIDIVKTSKKSNKNIDVSLGIERSGYE
ncbi:hypothetical protein [Peptostreptococcus canis]|uniref:Phage Mu protein F like protein n=1 Tax=Peptostreptococcus canis TaxID=1159213 RepID=A0ABR6TII9_9FIRM|nr:hypothetical protein [Peptostreptococcus canis]MBC2575209.1 hypothetical protein [Peptostreptococcus canis]MBP1997614.1 hypothetical protein [Peptostreptococcus canis]